MSSQYPTQRFQFWKPLKKAYESCTRHQPSHRATLHQILDTLDAEAEILKINEDCYETFSQRHVAVLRNKNHSIPSSSNVNRSSDEEVPSEYPKRRYFTFLVNLFCFACLTLTKFIA